MLPSRLFFDDSFFKGEETVKCDVFQKDGKIFVEMDQLLSKKKMRKKTIQHTYIVQERVIAK